MGSQSFDRMKIQLINRLLLLLLIGLIISFPVVGFGKRDQAIGADEIERFASIAEKHAQAIVLEIGSNNLWSEVVGEIVDASNSKEEFSVRYRALDFAAGQISRIAEDDKARNMSADIGFSGFDDFIMLVIDIAYFKLLREGACPKVGLWLADSLVRTNVRSSPPETDSPNSCVRGFELSRFSTSIQDEPYNYLIRFGVCRNTGLVWAFDGEHGWHPANELELVSICTGELDIEITCNN